MSIGHHTPEQIEKAFKAVPLLIEKLKELGLNESQVVLQDDASGKVILGKVGHVTNGQFNAVQNLVYSHRYDFWDQENVTVVSCCGFVKFAEENS